MFYVKLDKRTKRWKNRRGQHFQFEQRPQDFTSMERMGLGKDKLEQCRMTNC